MSRRAAAFLAVLAGVAAGAAAALIGAAAHADVPWVVTVPAGLSLGALLAATFWLPGADPVVVPPAAPVAPTEIASFGDLPGLRFTVEQASRDARSGSRPGCDRGWRRSSPSCCGNGIEWTGAQSQVAQRRRRC